MLEWFKRVGRNKVSFKNWKNINFLSISDYEKVEKEIKDLNI